MKTITPRFIDELIELMNKQKEQDQLKEIYDELDRERLASIKDAWPDSVEEHCSLFGVPRDLDVDPKQQPLPNFEG